MNPDSWRGLFTDGKSAAVEIPLFLLRKAGAPFLVLPLQPALAAKGLQLYPAQTFPARLAKCVLRAALKTGLPLPLEKTMIPFSPEVPLPQFCAKLAGGKSIPRFALLAGNPKAAGRRFILLVFDERGNPVSVVKAGHGETAAALVRREEEFLSRLPGQYAGVPRVTGALHEGALQAFSMDFLEGVSPGGSHDPQMARVLGSWVDPGRTVALDELGLWHSVEIACARFPLFTKLSASLAGRRIHPALYHGDFAPWNIKVSPGDGSWKIFDWERGENEGMPGWDWFHYVIQQAVLVRRMKTEVLVPMMERLLVSQSFLDYAEKAGIRGVERELLLLYLLHCAEVLKPAEGIAALRELLPAFSAPNSPPR